MSAEMAPRSRNRLAASRYNFIAGALAYVVVVVLSFIVRTIFVRALGESYLGLNAVFLNAVALVSVAEAGVATATMFRLYAPLAKGDHAATREWLAASRFYYRIALTAIAALGTAVAFLLPMAVNDPHFTSGQITGYFWLALVGGLATCVFATDKVLLLASERNYVVVAIQSFVLIVQSALQVFVLLFLESFAAFLILQAIGTIAWNGGCRIWARRRFPADYFAGRSSISERRNLRADLSNLFPYKLGAVGLNATDSILIAIVLRATLAGVVSNYTLVVNSINGVLMQAFNGVAAAIGIHSAEADSRRRTEVFFQLTMLSIWVFGMASVCLVALLNPFIELWLGQRFLMTQPEVNALVCAFYVTGVNQVPSLYRSSLGIFRRTRLVPLVATGLNIVLSVALAHLWGLVGIFVGTVLARALTFNIVDPVLVSSAALESRPIEFFVRIGRATAGLVLMAWAVLVVREMVAFGSVWTLAIWCLIVVSTAALGVTAWLCTDRYFRGLLCLVAPQIALRGRDSD